jgi:hypothetical protein
MIVRMMTERAVGKLDFSRKPSLITVVLPVVFGLLHATQTGAATRAQNTAAIAPELEVASIKPNKYNSRMLKFGWFSPRRFTATGPRCCCLFGEAFGVKDHQLSGAPHWFKEGPDNRSRSFYRAAGADVVTAAARPPRSRQHGAQRSI